MKISCGAIITDRTKILACHSTGNSFWDLPKGQSNSNETDLEACLREVLEETGVVLDKDKVFDLGIHPYNKQKMLHLFLYKTEDLPDVNSMKCTSTFVNFYGKEMPEVDEYRYVGWRKYLITSLLIWENVINFV